MKQLLLAATAIAIFTLTTMAQDIKAPTITLRHAEGTSAPGTHGLTFDTLPNLCKPCVFYGGDFSANDPNAEGYANGNTLLVPNTAVYAAVDVPKNVNGAVTGILFMIDAADGAFDPATASYDIRTGISEGNGGNSVASGSGSMSYALYGRFGVYETAVNLTKPFTVTPGTRYWFNMQPQCTNSGNGACSGEEFYLVNTTQETNGLNAGAQPPYQMFFNSGFFGFVFENLCQGKNSPACARASYGLMGHQ